MDNNEKYYEKSIKYAKKATILFEVDFVFAILNLIYSVILMFQFNSVDTAHYTVSQYVFVIITGGIALIYYYNFYKISKNFPSKKSADLLNKTSKNGQ